MTERPTYCDDWSCPAAVSCAKHFGRSRAYYRMDDKARVGHGPGTIYFRGIRDSCERYEFDAIKPWLMPHAGAVTHLPKGQGGL
jgi:hypothetical protein